MYETKKRGDVCPRSKLCIDRSTTCQEGVRLSKSTTGEQEEREGGEYGRSLVEDRKRYNIQERPTWVWVLYSDIPCSFTACACSVHYIFLFLFRGYTQNRPGRNTTTVRALYTTHTNSCRHTAQDINTKTVVEAPLPGFPVATAS